MKVTIQFDTDNATLSNVTSDQLDQELRSILRDAAAFANGFIKWGNAGDSATLRDSNGNTIGSVSVS